MSNQNTKDNTLFQDVLKLASVLRKKGYDEQAEEVEKYLVAFKTAETHLYDAHNDSVEELFDLAYPEGDVEIVPGSGWLGEIQTPISSQKKMLEVVKKQPSGKYAEAANALLKDLSNILGVKSAQEAAGRENLLVSLVPLRDNILEIVNVHNIMIEIGGFKEGSLINVAGNPDQRAANAAYIGKYAKLAGVSVQDLIRYSTRYITAYGRGDVKPDMKIIYSRLANIVNYNDQRALRQFAGVIGNFTHYLDGVHTGTFNRFTQWISDAMPGAQLRQILARMFGGEAPAQNPNSIWEPKFETGKRAFYVEANKDRLAKLAEEMHTQLDAERTEVFGDKLESANKALKEEIEAFTKAVGVDLTAYTAQEAAAKTQTAIAHVYEYSPRGKRHKSFSQILIAFGSNTGEFNAAVVSFIKAARELLKKFGKHVGGFVTRELADTMAHRFKKAEDLLRAYINSLPAGDSNINKWYEELSFVVGFKDLSKTMANQPYNTFFDSYIKDVLPDRHNIQLFDRFSQEVLTGARNLATAQGVARASSESEIIKQSQQVKGTLGRPSGLLSAVQKTPSATKAPPTEKKEPEEDPKLDDIPQNLLDKESPAVEVKLSDLSSLESFIIFLENNNITIAREEEPAEKTPEATVQEVQPDTGIVRDDPYGRRAHINNDIIKKAQGQKGYDPYDFNNILIQFHRRAAMSKNPQYQQAINSLFREWKNIWRKFINEGVPVTYESLVDFQPRRRDPRRPEPDPREGFEAELPEDKIEDLEERLKSPIMRDTIDLSIVSPDLREEFPRIVRLRLAEFSKMTASRFADAFFSQEQKKRPIPFLKRFLDKLANDLSLALSAWENSLQPYAEDPRVRKVLERHDRRRNAWSRAIVIMRQKVDEYARQLHEAGIRKTRRDIQRRTPPSGRAPTRRLGAY